MKEIKCIITYFLIGAILLLASCISPYQPNIPAGDTRVLVAEGQITDKTGPFRVKLSRSFDFHDELYGDPETGAQVQIFDDKGNLFPLYYTVGGWYETEDTLLQGVPGNTYSLNITTTDGTQYESSPVLMQDMPEIDSVYFEEVQRTRFEDGKAIDENWLDIFLDTHDETGQTNYWKWDFEETWEVKTPKDSVTIHFAPDEVEEEPDFYVVVNVEFREGDLRTGRDNKKDSCWVTVPSASILIASTKDNQVDEINRFKVKSIPPKDDRLHIKYSIMIKQTALPYELYRYWKRLEESNEETGNIYDKIPEQIFGNIDCCNGEGKALGYFYASAVKTKRIFIKPLEHTVETRDAYAGCVMDGRWRYYLGHIVAVSNSKYSYLIGTKTGSWEVWCTDCREYGTNVKPDFWDE